MIRIPTCVASILFAALALAGGPAPDTAPAPSAGPVKTDGVSIEFVSHKLADGERTPQGELQAIVSSMATLKAERPIRYRSLVLPAGTYPVTVCADPSGRNMFFVIGAPAADRPEEKKSEKSEAKAGEAKAPAAAGKKAKTARDSGQIRALFHMRPATKPSESVQFSVRPTAKGDRFTIAVAAGSSVGRATLKFEK